MTYSKFQPQVQMMKILSMTFQLYLLVYAQCTIQTISKKLKKVGYMKPSGVKVIFE